MRKRRAGEEEHLEELVPGELDERDQSILEALRRLGEATAAMLVKETGIPKSPRYRRLKRREEAGIIESRRLRGKTYYRLRKK